MPDRKALRTREAILAAKHNKVTMHDVPEWGGQVGLRVLSAGEREQFVAWVMARKTPDGEIKWAGQRTKLLELTIADAAGVRLMQEGDAELLGGLSAESIERLGDIVLEQNRLTTASLTATKGN